MDHELTAQRELLGRAVLDAIPAAVAMLDHEGRIVEVNAEWEQLGRESGAELQSIGPGVGYLAVCERSAAAGDELAVEVLTGLRAVLAGRRGRFEFEYPCESEGRMRWFLLRAVRIDADPPGLVVSHFDVTDRRQAEHAQAASDLFAETLAAASPSILYVYDLMEQRNVYVNVAIARVLGYEPREIAAMGSGFMARLLHPDELERIASYHEELLGLPDGEWRSIQYRMVHKSGEERWLRSREVVFRRAADGSVRQIVGAAEDITDLRRNLAALESSEARFRELAEENARLLVEAREQARAKALLLEEVNHRVKNNLASILGILDLEESSAGRDIPLLAEVRRRIQALGTVHEMLSDTGWQPLAIQPLLGTIAGSVLRLAHREAVELQLTGTGEPIHLAPNRATALALIANELATNAAKYAFAGQGGSRFAIEISQPAERSVTIRFRDDGPGWPPELLAGGEGNVGLQVMRAAAASPLRGRLELSAGEGAEVSLTFPLQADDLPATSS